jgi:two-component system, OmpR family, sensor histidine kinase KdpD
MARSRLLSWIVWWTILLVATLVLRWHRSDLDAVHVVLIYLLVVLGGSVSGGQALGLALTVTCVLLIDYYFQVPYDALSVTKPLDLVVLVAFLTTAGVATQLLARERARAAEAELRASEVASLARLGAEVLSSGRAGETLTQIASVIRSSLELDECRIYGWGDGAMRLLAASPEREGGSRGPELARLRDLIESAATGADESMDTAALQRYDDDARTLVTVLWASSG